MNLIKWNFRKLKKRLKRKKKVRITTRQLPVPRPHNGTPGWWATVWCVSTNFLFQILILKQRQIFKISFSYKSYYPLRKTIYFQLYLNNHQEIYKTAQNIDM